MCKSALPLLLKSLLISPYWNVNIYAAFMPIYPLTLLISPYWNVNWPIAGTKTTFVAAFNLSILECKFASRLLTSHEESTFNLSILECKYCLYHFVFRLSAPFNLSILECK